jgi:rRNA maturation endonuclease Nob1
MGFFENLGRTVEEFKQTVESTADDAAEYQCRACGESLHANHETCLECGEDAVRAVDETE